MPPDDGSQSGAFTIGADHNLEGPVTVDTAKVKVAFWWYIGNVGRHFTFLAQFPDDGRGSWVVNGNKNHGCAIQVGGFEETIDVGNLGLFNTVGYFGIEARGRADNGDIGIGIEAVEDPARGNLFQTGDQHSPV